ncbi:hypothetical protein PAPYR_4821 [Paratrimastix pyriformis]|uniref:Uncharacterized protein n=1 Tax=Paratrimastix pyriformis TaxID=342808 RepID=A0ABQ8UJ86_9EUKA|nr:hypothetical protein PAPYR_4821 [Paratrimastix pyriformis]
MRRGTLRELSLAVAPDLITFSGDALAELLGPCKSLRKLRFSGRSKMIDASDGLTVESAVADWVDEAFGGHTQLAVLEQLPPLAEPAIERILSHLSGLVELTVSPDLHMNTDLLAILARSCPRLQVLRCSLPDDDDRADPVLFSVLAPISGVLKELDLRSEGWWSPEVDESLAAFVGSLSAVTSLKLFSCCASRPWWMFREVHPFADPTDTVARGGWLLLACLPLLSHPPRDSGGGEV